MITLIAINFEQTRPKVVELAAFDRLRPPIEIGACFDNTCSLACRFSDKRLLIFGLLIWERSLSPCSSGLLSIKEHFFKFCDLFSFPLEVYNWAEILIIASIPGRFPC